MIKITVPATSANLGIGYDTLGMAVSLYSHFTFERADKLTITGCPEEFQNENNLVYVSFVDALAAWGEPAFPVAIDIQTDVPVARGLGSSSTCVVAGIMAAAALTGHTVDRAELVRIATEVEGHPDNVAPAILGGAVCSFTPTDSLPQCLRYEVSDRLRFITVIPLRGTYERGTQGCAAGDSTLHRCVADGPHRRHDARSRDRRSGPDCRRQ